MASKKAGVFGARMPILFNPFFFRKYANPLARSANSLYVRWMVVPSAVTWWIARAEGSMVAARGRKDVVESVWMCGGVGEEVVVDGVEEAEEATRWERTLWRRIEADDILVSVLNCGECLDCLCSWQKSKARKYSSTDGSSQASIQIAVQSMSCALKHYISRRSVIRFTMLLDQTQESA